MKCHLVYSVPYVGGRIKKGVRKIKVILQRAGFPISVIGDREKIDTSFWPISAPSTITKHLYEYFSSKMPTILYHLNERINIRFEPDDIFIGTPFFPFTLGKSGVTDLSIQSNICPKVFALIAPLHCNIDIKTKHINKDYLASIVHLMNKADILFAIMGKYWWDQWDHSPYTHWKPKMIRLDMAVDVRDFPRVKKRFNPKGERGFLYIGNSDPVKGIDFLIKLASCLKEFSFGYIGHGKDIPGVRRISTGRPLTPEFMSEVAKHFDFFITTGVADANPTTILESMAWGFPVICTPQSGYYETEYLKNVFHEDIEKSIGVLHELQFMEENELITMADKARAVVETEYNWDKFLNTIWKTLENEGVI